MTKRLIDLNPRWSSLNRQVGRRGIFLCFDCPCDEACTQSPIILAIENPVDGKPQTVSNGRDTWHRTGESFKDLTLTPSFANGEHWYGKIEGGIVMIAPN